MSEGVADTDTLLVEALEAANTLISDGRMQEAVHELERILRKHPDCSDGYAMLTSLYLAMERTDIRREWVLKAVKNTPSLSTTFLSLAHRLYTEERLQECSRVLEALIWGDPDNCEAWNDFGAVRYAMDDIPTAERSFNQALALNPNYGEALMNLAGLYVVTNREGQGVQVAMEVMERKCEVDPQVVREMAELLQPVAPEEAAKLLGSI